MNPLGKIPITCSFLWLGLTASAQYISIDDNYTTGQLVNDVLIGNPCAQASNIAVSGWSFSSGNTFGYFDSNESGFPFENGIVLTTGRAASAVGPNTSILSEGPVGWNGDGDLENALGLSNTINATVLEFDFLPQASRFSFDYIFSSEQYLSNPSPNQCGYTDGFAFLLKKADNSEPYQNLAVLPNTNIPVTVNTVRGFGTVCDPANEQYFDAFNGSQHPTNYNGQTAVMTARANVEPGVLYHIKIVIADQGNNLYDSAIFLGGGSFRIQKDLGPDRTFELFQPLCDGDALTVNAAEAGAANYQWYRDGALIPGANAAEYTITQPGTYRVEFTLNSCTGSGEIKVDYAQIPVINTPLTLTQCGSANDATTTFNLALIVPVITNNDPELNGMHFFTNMADAEAEQNPILEPLAYTTTLPRQVFAKIFNAYECFTYAVINLELSTVNIAPIDAYICDDDNFQNGSTSFSLTQHVTPQVLGNLPPGYAVRYFLTQQQALLEQDQLPDSYMNSGQGETIYARIVNGPSCYDIVPVALHVSFFGASEFGNQDVGICEGSTAVLAAPGGYSSYAWSTGETSAQVTVGQTGSYSVTVTDEGGCDAIKTFEVIEMEAPVFVSAAISDFQGNSNSVTVNYQGSGSYEFSLNGDFFQPSPDFHNVAPGEYAVYIRDAAGCYLIGPYAVFVSDFPRYFTPNGDGIHDLWKPSLYTAEPASISIFDRYGKLLLALDGNGAWDGKYEAKELPATDYWFVIAFHSGRVIKGHFTLKR